MTLNLLDKTHQNDGGRELSNSARKAAEIWDVSPTLVTNAIEAGTLWPQNITQDGPDSKPAYSFHIEYIKEVLEVLPAPSKRGKNQKVFTSAIKEKIKPINEKWMKRYYPDSTDRFLMIAKVKR